jgi:hypothetical protein
VLIVSLFSKVQVTAALRRSVNYMHLVEEILSSYPLVSKVEGLMASLFSYFSGRPKQCIELAKLASIMETKDVEGRKDEVDAVPACCPLANVCLVSTGRCW